MRHEISQLLAERLVNRIEETNAFIYKKIGETIKAISTLKPGQAYQLTTILKYGGSYTEIAQELAKASGKNVQEIYKIFEEVAKENKFFAKEFYHYRGIDYIPYWKDVTLQTQVNSIARLTANTYLNISNTRGIGFAFKDINDNIVFKDLQQSYFEIIDRGILAISQGKETFTQEMNRMIAEMGHNGIVLYDSGKTRRLDSSIRMNLLDGIRQLNQETTKTLGAQYDADGVEITVHSNPAPDHEDIQGRQFRIEEYNKLQNGEKAKDVQGIEYDGSQKRHIGQYNCYHDIINIIIGVTEPQYTDKELQQIRDNNAKGFEFEGKHYTMYEGTQLQRKIELEIRKQKDTQILARACGKDFESTARDAEKKIRQLTSKYNELSRVSGLPTQKQRMSVVGYKRISIK